MNIDKPAVHGTLTMLPEWAQQEAVVLAWPHMQTDWQEWIDEVRKTYLQLIEAINHCSALVILLCPEDELGLVKSMVSMNAKVLLVQVDYNDTWTRDYVFITCESANGNVPVNFNFNGWGEKFDASKDNKVNTLLSKLCRQDLINHAAVLEGGAVEIDQNQMLMSTSSCLLNPKRNSQLSLDDYGSLFESVLGARESHIFKHGHLEGDDTDGHIDTLARFTPLRSIVMQSAFNRPADLHFKPLNALKAEIKNAFPGFAIFELPLPEIHNASGERLPASYANFLICNKGILAPIYQQEEDEQAIETLQKAFPNHEVIPIDCSSLVQQYGSLHCVTMQIPENTMKTEILELATNGLASYTV
ncbi:agmatine deiminase family protein [Ningiella sp. W23]|uniref:agmatine deiminase family protein n=1 Tax=Ningiella sp. W23 TaxID=3023715 RepID=UPI0037580BBD